MAWENYTDGKITERGNDNTRTVTTYNTDGTTKSTRPYTAAENAAADDTTATAALAANEAALRNGLQAAIGAALARQAEYQAVLDATNATINGSPSVTHQGRRQAGQAIRTRPDPSHPPRWRTHHHSRHRHRLKVGRRRDHPGAVHDPHVRPHRDPGTRLDRTQKAPGSDPLTGPRVRAAPGVADPTKRPPP